MSLMSLGPTDGRLTITALLTNPLGRSTRGVTLTMTDWNARIHFDTDEVHHVEVEVIVESMEVSPSDPDASSLTDIDQMLIRRTVLASLRAKNEPTATFVSTAVAGDRFRYQLSGDATIAGRSLATRILVDVADATAAWSVTGQLDLLHGDFGINPPAVLGAFKAPGQVTVRLDAQIEKPTA